MRIFKIFKFQLLSWLKAEFKKRFGLGERTGVKGRKKRISGCPGFTLIEILIYTGLLSVVLILVTTFLYQSANFRVNHQLESSLFQNSQMILNNLSQDISRATAIISPNDDSFVDWLELETPDGTIIYSIDSGSLERNGVSLTDDQVEVRLAGIDQGFRRIGETVQFRLAVRSRQKPFGRPPVERLYQSAVSVSQLNLE